MSKTHNIHPGSGKMFDNPFLERMTHTHVAVPISIFVIYSATLVYWAAAYTSINLTAIPLLFLAGFLFFTFIEYWAHRKLYHIEPSTPRKKRLQYIMHGVHHDHPKDKSRLAMPPLASLLLATLFHGLFYLVLNQYAFSFSGGFLIGYAFYLLVHYAVHAYRPPKSKLNIFWRHHALHHYKYPELAFGVSSPLWDVVFRTMPPTEK